MSPATSASKILLCRPRGGFNDCLNQIERCWRYAEVHDRRLVVDSTRRSICDHFDRYFEALDPHANASFRLDPDELGELEARSTRPSELGGRVGSYQATWDPEQRCFADRETGIRSSFDFTRDHPEALLVHESCGGGDSGAECLARLRLTPGAASAIRARLSVLGEGYVAIHVRNSDLRTDYESLFDGLRAKTVGKQLLICSDDVECKEFAKSFFREASVVEVSRTPRTSGLPLHEDAGLIEKLGSDRMNLDMLTDLLALAGARELYYADVESKGKPSGYSRLAGDLQQRRDLVEALLSAQSPSG